MASPIEILIQARDNASPAIKQVDAAISSLGNNAHVASSKLDAAGTRASKSFSETASKIDRVGTSARIGLSGAAQAADLLGLEIGGIVAPATMAADAIGDMASGVGTLGLAAGGLGIVIAAFALYQKAIADQRAEIEKNILANSAFVQSLDGVAKANTTAASELKAYVTAQAEYQQAQNFASASGGKFGQATVEAASGVDTAKAKVDLLAISLDDLAIKSEHAASVALIHAGAEAERALQLDYAAAAAKRLANEMGDTRGEAIKEYRDGSRVLSEMNTKAWFLTHEFKEGVGWVEKMPTALDKAKTSAAGLANTASQIASKLKGLVENALTPTATAEGADTWDEARKRFEAFASGTDTAAYGEDFKKMFDSLGMSASEAAARFKDFSLFALKPELLQTDLIGWQQITNQVEQQLLSMAGKAMVTKQAMQEVWKNLSPQAKSALAEQGIDNATEALMALTDPAQKAQKDVKGLNDQISAIPTLVPTTFDAITTSAKNAIQDLADFLDKFINAYGSITVSANGEFSSPNNGGDTGGNTGGDTFGSDTPPSFYAKGTDFVVPGGYPNDSYKHNMRLTSGERLIVIPKDKRGSVGGGTFIFNVSVTSDAMLRKLDRMVRGYAAHGMA